MKDKDYPTLRDWYAGMAMQTILTYYRGEYYLGNQKRVKEAAKLAFAVADAMLKEAEDK